MKKLFSLMVLVLLLTGCSSDEKTTTICKGNIDELTTTNVTIESEGDKVSLMKHHLVYDLSGMVTDDLPIDSYWLPAIKSLNPDYSELKGGKAKYTVDGEKIYYDVEIDYNKADLDELKDAKLITTNKDGKVVFISLEETIKEQEKGGLTCKEK